MERLNKFLAHAGIGSRRRCEDLIRSGRVSVDGAVVRDLGTKIDPAQQEVTVNRQTVTAERHTYWLVNKPRGYLCTNHDPGKRPLAIELVPPHVQQRVYPVGRLDEQSEGLLLLTNDGELAHRLMHPRFGVEKSYLVQVAGTPKRSEIQSLLDGIWLSDGRVRAKRVVRMRKQGDSTWLLIVLNEGKNREIRRMLAKLEHKVMRLKRVALGPIRIGRLGKGRARPLKPEEVELLRRISRPSAEGDAEESKPPRSRRKSARRNRHGKPAAEATQPARRNRNGKPAAAATEPSRKPRPGNKTNRAPARPKARLRRRR